ncbi:hypothetical protein D3C85_896620 [compost metagenome]
MNNVHVDHNIVFVQVDTFHTGSRSTHGAHILLWEVNGHPQLSTHNNSLVTVSKLNPNEIIIFT